MKLEPLEQFFCDSCGEIILTPEEGWVEWIGNTFDAKYLTYGYRIVHHASASPRKEEGMDCYNYTKQIGVNDRNLKSFMGDNILIALYNFLDKGSHKRQNYLGPDVEDMREFVDFMRRLTIPYYEEARLYWDMGIKDGYFTKQNAFVIFSPEFLQSLIEEYEAFDPTELKKEQNINLKK